MRKFLVFAILFVTAAVLLAGILASIRRFVKVSDFKRFAESRLGDLLKARVHVNEVRVGFLDHIALRGLQINQEIQNKVFYLLDVDQVVFKYHLARFWRQNFRRPSTIFLDSPQIILRSFESPFVFLDIERILVEGDRLTDEIDFEEGKIRFEVPRYRMPLEVEKVRGKLRKIEKGRWRFEMEGRIHEFLDGVAALEGTVDVESQKFSMRLTLKTVSSIHPSALPLKGLSGTVRVENDAVFIENLRFEYNRIPIELEGKIDTGEKAPALDLRISMGGKELGTVLYLKGALENSEVKGALEIGGMRVGVQGTLASRAEGIRIENLRLGELFDGQAAFDMNEGLFHLYLERDKQRIDIASSLKSWQINFAVEVDHLPFFGADVVSRTRFELKPDEPLWETGQWAFEGYLVSDYLILDRTPFPDFQGSFHIASTEITQMNFRWGEGYELEGRASLKPPFPLEVRIHLREIRLDEITSLFSKPLPDNFGGVADGGVRIWGEDWRVEAEGALQISEGQIGEFDYSRLSLHFYGIPPYLRLKDSRLKKGMRTFHLEGAIDLSKKNLFHDIRVSSSEKILVWSGRELLIGKEKRKSTSADLDIPGRRGKSLRVAAKKNEEESYLAVGPKFQF